MKLIVMIPCLNEEKTLHMVIDSIPHQIEGLDEIELMILDDGSTDDTVGVARRLGVNHIVRHKQNRGLARAFQSGLDACLDLGADIIVNSDGDNQYPSQSIPELIEPVLRGRADIAIGDRQTHTIEEFSGTKKLLERLGSWMVRCLSGVNDLPDAVSGFRAYTRSAASRLYLTSTFSYTIESVVLAGNRGLVIESVPITTNAKTRPSRLYTHLPGFICRSATTMIRSYTMYKPLCTFLILGAVSIFIGLIISGRVTYLASIGEGRGHVQSVILAAVMLIGGLLLWVLGLLADLITSNRKLLEELVWREKMVGRGMLHGNNGSAEIGEVYTARPLARTESMPLGEVAENKALTKPLRSRRPLRETV